MSLKDVPSKVMDIINSAFGRKEEASPKYTYDANSQKYTKMKNGGTASSRADGCCVKGKTKGRMV